MRTRWNGTISRGSLRRAAEDIRREAVRGMVFVNVYFDLDERGFITETAPGFGWQSLRGVEHNVVFIVTTDHPLQVRALHDMAREKLTTHNATLDEMEAKWAKFSN